MELFKNNIAFLRKKGDLKQKEVAESLSVGFTTWSDYERGRSEPDISTLIQISEYFRVSLDILLKEDVQLLDDNVLYQKTPKSTAKSTDYSTANKEKLTIVEEEQMTYLSKSQEQVISSQKHVIDTQKALIDSLSEHILLLKEKK